MFVDVNGYKMSVTEWDDYSALIYYIDIRDMREIRGGRNAEEEDGDIKCEIYQGEKQ